MGFSIIWNDPLFQVIKMLNRFLHKQWDPSILWNDKLFYVEVEFGSPCEALYVGIGNFKE